jgi:hypothetical protein
MSGTGEVIILTCGHVATEGPEIHLGSVAYRCPLCHWDFRSIQSKKPGYTEAERMAAVARVDRGEDIDWSPEGGEA